jgi:hypothetical protein
MKRGNIQRGINLLLAAMLLALGLYPVGAVSAQGPQFLNAGERAPQAEATSSIRYVKQGGSTTGECQSWGTACDLQTALETAVSGDELWVAGGIYTPGASGVVTATFHLVGGVQIYGGFAGDETTLGQRNWTAHPTILSGDIDQNDVTQSGVVTNTAQIKGENAYQVVSASAITNTVLDGFTITAGSANSAPFPEDRGGGMYIDNHSKFTIRNVTFSGNSARYGGGIANNGSSPTLIHVTFFGNSAEHWGGGMINGINKTGGSPSLTEVTFSGNKAYDGGGMDNESGRPSLTHVTFSGNKATDDGGGMYNYGGSPTLTDVTLSGNSADILGGGMYNEGSDPTLTNVTFSGNTVGQLGGGMYNYESSPTLTNVTMSGNSAVDKGGGVYNESSNSKPTLTNAILWGNTPADNQIINAGSTITVTYSDIQLQAGGVYTGTGNINLDPLFVDAASGNLRLQSTSPAIDAGDNAAPGLVGITTDLDGNPRFADDPGVVDTGSGSAPIVDMGAYEYIPQQIFLPLLSKH